MTKEFHDGKFGRAASEQTAGEAPAVDLDAMTKAELLAEAQRLGVDVSESSTKAEIIETITAAG